MSKFSELPGQAMDLVSQVGSNLREHVPDKALKWVETGAALTAARTGARTATKFARRNPVVAVAVAAGAGLLWYAARRRAKQVREQQDDAIEGSARRIEAKPVAPRTRRTSTARATRPQRSRTTSRNSEQQS